MLTYKDFYRSLFTETLRLSSKIWLIDPKGKLVDAKDVPSYAHRGSNMLDLYKSGFIRIGYSGTGSDQFLDMMYNYQSSPSPNQWKSVKVLCNTLGADEVHDIPKKRTVWVK